jgi:hypothetical protein
MKGYHLIIAALILVLGPDALDWIQDEVRERRELRELRADKARYCVENPTDHEWMMCAAARIELGERL